MCYTGSGRERFLVGISERFGGVPLCGTCLRGRARSTPRPCNRLTLAHGFDRGGARRGDAGALLVFAVLTRAAAERIERKHRGLLFLEDAEAVLAAVAATAVLDAL